MVIESWIKTITSILKGNFEILAKKRIKRKPLIKGLDERAYISYALNYVPKMMSSAFDSKELLDIVIRMFTEIGEVEKCSIMLINEETKKLEIKVVMDKGVIEYPKIELEIDYGLPGEVIKKGTPYFINYLNEDNTEFIYKHTGDGLEEEIDSLMCVPLVGKRGIIGVVNTYNRINNRGFTQEDVNIMSTLAHQAAVSFENAHLYELATIDGLTKLYIHRYFQIRLAEEMARSRRYKNNLSIFIADVDYLNKFNETYGREQGDIVLAETGDVIRKWLRKDIDIPCRYGGEEFAVILPETDTSNAFFVAERLRREVEEHKFPGVERILRVTISIGLTSLLPNSDLTKESLIRQAEDALAMAKGSGRNKVCVNV
ncbi:MAG: sensor domain-containing diguanylate cyclase [bacterium]|nr:sensor domain-containing diguanylate cyclase [bacterium]